jgi:hypothetical protein
VHLQVSIVLSISTVAEGQKQRLRRHLTNTELDFVIEILLSKEPKICVMLHFQKKPILGANLRARKKLYVAVSDEV